MNCAAGNDVSRVSQLKRNGDRPYFEDPIYSFDEPLEERVVLAHIKEAFDTALAEAVAKRKTLQRFYLLLDWEGVIRTRRRTSGRLPGYPRPQ